MKEKCLFLCLWTCGFFRYTVGIKEGRAFPLENTSPCSSNVRSVYLLPHLSKCLSSYFCSYNLSLPAQISETTEKADKTVVQSWLYIVYWEQREEQNRTTKKVSSNYLRLCLKGLQTLFTVLVGFAAQHYTSLYGV